MNNIFVLVPAFNEEKTIVKVINEINNNIEANIVVIDDGSEDETFKVAKKTGVRVLQHIINLGQWAALKTGFIYALRNHADIVITLDADGQHSGNSINKLINALIKENADIVIGSRLSDGKSDMIFYRYLGIKLFNLLLRLRIGYDLSDCTSGYRVYKSDILKKMIKNINEQQYGSLESIIVAVKNDAKIVEVPIETSITKKSSKGKYRYGYNLLRTILKEPNNK